MGVKKLQRSTSEGDKLVSVVFALMHHKSFGIVKHKLPNNQHSVYAVVLLCKSGRISKRNIKGLCDKPYNTQGEAKASVRQWDTQLK